MTFIENLTREEKEAIEELQMRMTDDLPQTMSNDIHVFHNFLVARDFDVDKAEKMLRKHIVWRKSMQVDTILEDFKPKEVFIKYIYFSHIGIDRDGDMVKYIPLGKIDGRDILKCMKMNDYMKHTIWVAEETALAMKQLKEKTGRGSTHFVYIMDLDKLTIGNVTCKETINFSLRFLSIVFANYPEVLKTAYVINSPPYYTFLYNLVKPMMSTAMKQKLQIFGYSGWKEKLLEIVDADDLPAFLGGNRTDPDGNPLCTSFIRHAGKLPEKYNLSDEERYFKEKSQVKHIHVLRKEKEEIPIDVTEKGSLILWEFLVKSKDIGFGLSYEVSESKLKEILPVFKYDTIDGTEEGYYECQRVGKYIIVFDNSYSWMNSKDVEYCIKVIKPAS